MYVFLYMRQLSLSFTTYHGTIVVPLLDEISSQMKLVVAELDPDGSGGISQRKALETVQCTPKSGHTITYVNCPPEF